MIYYNKKIDGLDFTIFRYTPNNFIFGVDCFTYSFLISGEPEFNIVKRKVGTYDVYEITAKLGEFGKSIVVVNVGIFRQIYDESWGSLKGTKLKYTTTRGGVMVKRV